MTKRVILTGPTSFTGAHIARAFVSRGFEVVGALSRERNEYQSGKERQRLDYSKLSNFSYSSSFGSSSMLDLIAKFKPDVFINHGASITGYRDPNFDYLSSVGLALKGAKEVFEALVKNACSRFIHSGSIFEPDEGTPGAGTENSSPAISIYGTSKNMVWQALRHWGHQCALPLSKVVIANPIGPLENGDRLVPRFVATWKSGGVATLMTPNLVRDNVPATWLAEVYVQEAASQALSVAIRRPSAFKLTNEGFVKMLVEQWRPFAKSWDFQIKVQPVTSSEPLERVNSESLTQLNVPEAERVFFSEWFESFR